MVEVPRQLNLALFEHHLTNHPDTSFANRVLDHLTNGARIGYTGSRCARVRKNWPSAINNIQAVAAIIHDDVRRGRKVGPFPTPPFATFVGSPMGAIPKKLSDSVRIVHDLSFPPGVSINDSIPKDLCSVQYMALDDAIRRIVTSGTGTLMAKLDLKDAYKHIVVHPDDWDLLGLTLHQNGQTQYFVDVTLPFGLSSAPRIFTEVADALAYIMLNNGVTYVDHYLDDYFTIGPPGSPICASNMAIMLDTCRKANFEISSSPGKVVWPSTVIEFLGFILDSERMEIRISEARKQEIMQELISFLALSHCTKRHLLSLIGKLGFASRVVRAGRTFIRRLIQVASSTKYLHHHVCLSATAKRDIQWWLLFLPRWNGISLMPSPIVDTSESIQLFTDASLVGLGAVCGTAWWVLAISEIPCLQGHTIAYLELFAVVTAIATFSTHLQGRTILLHCDNAVIVSAVNKGTCRCPKIMCLTRALFYYCAQANILVQCQYIKSSLNSAADALSRLDLPRFRAEWPQADLQPTHPVDIRDILAYC